MKRLFVIDAVGFIFRSYHAIRGLTNERGQSTGALYGFIQTVRKLLKEHEPAHMVAVFDGPNNKASRLAIYPDYKANRGPCPEDLLPQIAWTEEFCHAYGIPVLCSNGVEADDVMGSVATWAANEGCEVFVCTGDKDMAQIVSDEVHLLNLHTKDPKKAHLDPQAVKEVFGVQPSQIIDLLAMIGDTSDNVPGLPGIGAKTAAALLEEYESVDKLLAHTNEIKAPKRRQAIEENQDTLRLSQRLVALDLDVDFPKSSSFFCRQEAQTDRLRSLYHEMNFAALLKELAEAHSSSHQVDTPPRSCTFVDSEEAFAELINALQSAPEICFDTETTDVHPMRAQLVGIGFCTAPGRTWYVPCNGPLEKDKILKALKPLFEDPQKGFFAHNSKYDCHILENEGISIARLSFDTILASYLLHSHDRRHSLDHLSLEHLNIVKTPTEALIGKGAKQITMDQVDPKTVGDYCCEDVDCTWQLKTLLEPKLEERGLDALLFDMELPLSRVLLRMERAGIYMDPSVLQDLGAELRQSLASLQESIYALAGKEFNLNSPKQLGEVLFGDLGIPAPKKTKTGYSTSAAVLEALRTEHPVIEHILDYRTLEKLRSTYVESLPHEILAKTGRIHCSFQQSVAATGRLSSTDPNLQNIPIRTSLGRRVREAFMPERKNWSFLSADYSQIELRLLAHMSEDPILIDAFLHGEDIHTTTAAHIFHISKNEVSKSQRYQAKAVNFGILYGQQAFGLSQQLGVSRSEADEFITTYFERFPRVQAFIEECKDKARKTGKAVTLTGRERILPEINSKNGQLRSMAERLAVNSPLQGTAADLIKLAMLDVQQALDKAKMLSYLVLQIHDELLFEAPDHELIDLEHTARQAMENIWTLKVPLLVDVSIGKNWKEC